MELIEFCDSLVCGMQILISASAGLCPDLELSDQRPLHLV